MREYSRWAPSHHLLRMSSLQSAGHFPILHALHPYWASHDHCFIKLNFEGYGTLIFSHNPSNVFHQEFK